MEIKKYLWRQTYLSRIMGSVDSNLWRSFWIEDQDGQEVDLIRNGDLSCALHVSGVLLNLNPRSGSKAKFVSGPMTKVDQLHQDLLANGWEELKFNGVESVQSGDVIFWEELRGYNGREAGGPHGHCGFYIGEEKGISVIPRTGNPQIHDYLYRDQKDYIGNFEGRDQREISLVLRCTKLLDSLPQPAASIKTDIDA
jgi:hypothetical protein